MIAQLNPRERWALVAGGLVVLVTIIYLGIISPYLNALNLLDTRIIARQRQVKEVQALRQEYLQLQRQTAEAEQRMAKAGAGFSLFAFVEAVTVQVATKENLVYMRPQQPSAQGEFSEESVEIKLEKIRIDQLVRLLYSVESADAYLQVKSLRVRTRFDNRSMLDAVLTISSFGRSK
jgi:general secretion pathway protein M